MPNEETHFTNQDRKVLTQLEINVARLLEDMNKFTNAFVDKSEFNALCVRVSNLENNSTWVVRTVVGVVILALLSLIVIK